MSQKTQYALRPGCRLFRAATHAAVLDDLSMVSVPINQSGYELLADLGNTMEFTHEEATFIDDLLELSLVVPARLLCKAYDLRKYFNDPPAGPYRSAAV